MKHKSPHDNNKYHPGELVKYDLIGGPYHRNDIVTEGQFTIFLRKDKKTNVPKVVNDWKGPLEKDIYTLDICEDGHLRYFYDGSE